MNSSSSNRVAFFVAFGIGAVGIFIGLMIPGKVLPYLFTLGIPVVAMAAFWAFGYAQKLYAATGAARMSFADSIYYLGFIFTLVSLVASLFAYTILSTPDDEDFRQLFARFASAIVTTIVGLVARTVLVGFEAEHGSESSEEHLVRAGNLMQDHLHQLNVALTQQAKTWSGLFAQARSEFEATMRTAEQQREALHDAFEELNQALRRNKTQFEEITIDAAALAQLVGSMEQASQSVANFVRAAESMDVAHLETASKAYVENLEGTTLALREQQDALGNSELPATLSSLNAALLGCKEQIAALDIDPEKINRLTDAAARSAAAVSGFLNSLNSVNGEDFAAASKRHAESIANVTEALKKQKEALLTIESLVRQGQRWI